MFLHGAKAYLMGVGVSKKSSPIRKLQKCRYRTSQLSCRLDKKIISSVHAYAYASQISLERCMIR